MAEIIIENVRKSFGDFVAVEGSSFKVEDGEFFMLLGPSGCGKTTTLRMIAGLELPSSGTILLDGEDVTYRRAAERDIAFVFQMFALYPHMNVRKNIGYPLASQGMARSDVRRKVEEVAEILRITDLLDRSVGGLSGGDRQRVALGRAIVREPKAFMMDEPLGALDAEFREIMAHELRALHNRMGATTVYVTHDQLEAMQMGDKIVVMNHGIVEQFGRPQEIYDRPATKFVADFIGSPSMNFLGFEGAVKTGDENVILGDATVELPAIREDLHHRSLCLGVRPEHIRFRDDSAIRANVFETEYLGTTQIVTVETAHGRLKARLPAHENVKPGEQVGLSFVRERLSLFDDVSGRAIATDLETGGQNG